MRTILIPWLILFLAIPPLPAAAQSGGGNIATASITPADADFADTPAPAGTAGVAEGDPPIRWMYVGMGGLAAFMLATMPVTLTAIAASVAAALGTSWAYDHYMAP